MPASAGAAAGAAHAPGRVLITGARVVHGSRKLSQERNTGAVLWDAGTLTARLNASPCCLIFVMTSSVVQTGLGLPLTLLVMGTIDKSSVPLFCFTVGHDNPPQGQNFKRENRKRDAGAFLSLKH